MLYIFCLEKIYRITLRWQVRWLWLALSDLTIVSRRNQFDDVAPNPFSSSSAHEPRQEHTHKNQHPVHSFFFISLPLFKNRSDVLFSPLFSHGLMFTFARRNVSCEASCIDLSASVTSELLEKMTGLWVCECLSRPALARTSYRPSTFPFFLYFFLFLGGCLWHAV